MILNFHYPKNFLGSDYQDQVSLNGCSNLVISFYFLKIKKKRKKKRKEKTFINFTNTVRLTPKPPKNLKTVAAGGVNTHLQTLTFIILVS